MKAGGVLHRTNPEMVDRLPLEDHGLSLAGVPMMVIGGLEGAMIVTGEVDLQEEGEAFIEEVDLLEEIVLIVLGLLIGEAIEEDTEHKGEAKIKKQRIYTL